MSTAKRTRRPPRVASPSSPSAAARRLARRVQVGVAVVCCAVFAGATALARTHQKSHARHAARSLAAPAPFLAIVQRDLARNSGANGGVLPAATVADPTSATS